MGTKLSCYFNAHRIHGKWSGKIFCIITGINNWIIIINYVWIVYKNIIQNDNMNKHFKVTSNSYVKMFKRE